MNKKGFYFSLLIMSLMLITAGAAWGMVNSNREVENFQVSVVLDESTNDRWIALREGMEQAARDNHIKLNVVSTGAISYTDERILIDRELENEAEGIVVQMISSQDSSAYIEELSQKTAVILLDTDISPEDVYPAVTADNIEIGRALAKAILEDPALIRSNIQIGVLCGHAKQLSMQQRLEGLEEGLLAEGLKPTWILETGSPEMTGKLEQKMSETPASILVSLGDPETESAVDYFQSQTGMQLTTTLYGVGCSEKNVYFLDQGLIRTLVVPNEFNMGYQSISAIAEKLKYKLSDPVTEKVNYLVVNKENLYDAKNQKILFPIVQ
ncbi:MAG: substrate-binding domain-containing protein [Lachnospiraceae bacterium]|nr:substrate-binding domain-containing protein [Lachnospiraceae bacterium]